MRISCLACTVMIACIWTFNPVRAGEELDVAQYKCSQFLEDAMKPKDGIRLLRSMMVIAWSTGYAAAYGKDNARADPEAIRLIAATLAAVCTKNPNQTVINAAVHEIHSLFSEAK